MIWTFIAIGIFVVGIVLYIIGKIVDDVNIDCAAMVFSILGGIPSIIIIIVIIATHTQSEFEINKAALLAQREALVYQLDNKIYLGDTIGEFNSYIISSQKYHENPWTNWFVGDWVMEVEPIALGNGGEK